ncbi:winged helix-turn helix containing protein [Clostridium pasteurianum DSM 525 = ATCC 6013]|uniref:Winged helix-turn helix containing protein n=1 Tax=Clostridium pasteurianum DSM 525 = ATCC 6013 TaxID=1262449 RepID=A0A0H3J1A4_CLOPA|nr:winged helix-turn helix containing protein [Clostridium pasteurianum DSM 525 = ATCC 6013]AJA50485.1 winged helix-turn helix containing protein [Clostridium pasteurianum DSM 525 = ATCC 6013]KRU13503.1 hypothetical protein CP6013_02751 [Clostridium pasteurianum DSM 525 = ATCC 6013]
MGRTATKVTNLKDISLDQLRTFEKNSTNKYSQNFLKTIIMSYLGVHISKIEEIVGVSRASVLSYIHKWDEFGLKAINDQRGGSVSPFTDEMLYYIQDALINKDPREFGFNASTRSPVGHPSIIERNASSIGLKLIGATEIPQIFNLLLTHIHIVRL